MRRTNGVTSLVNSTHVSNSSVPPPMDSPQALQHPQSSHPTLAFPLGTALLLILVFTLSGLFSCCYHWDKLRHLRPSFSDQHHSPSKPPNPFSENSESRSESLPVVMPGDRIATFIALPCPCQPPRIGNVVLEQQVLHNTPKPSSHVSLTLC